MLLNQGGDQNQVFYIVKVNGAVVSPQFSNRNLAEAQLAQLPAETRQIAVVETVTAGGNQMLLG